MPVIFVSRFTKNARDNFFVLLKGAKLVEVLTVKPIYNYKPKNPIVV